jgi:WD40 repeat protein
LVSLPFSRSRPRSLIDAFVARSQDTTIRVWHKDTGKLYRTLAGHRGPVNAVQLLNNRIVSASGDSLMKLWDVLTGEVIRVFTGHDRGLACVQYSTSGRYLASGSNDKSVKVWDVETGACLATLTGHTDLVRSLAFDELSGRVVSGSYDRTTRVWDLETGKETHKFKGHTSLVFDVAVSPTRILRCVLARSLARNVEEIADALSICFAARVTISTSSCLTLATDSTRACSFNAT